MIISQPVWYRTVHTTLWRPTVSSHVCRLHISAATAGLTSTGWICKYDRGRLTAILCGIWCVVMLITASRHFHLSKFSTARWYIPHTYPSLHPHLSPICFPLLCLIYLRGRCSMKQQCCLCDLRLQPPRPQPPLLSVTIHHFTHFSLAPSIHLSHCLFVYLLRGRCDSGKRWSSRWQMQHPTVSVNVS